MIVLMFVAILISGCAKIEVVRPDGISIKYTRWGNQSMESFLMEADGSVLFEKQKSDNTALYEALNTAIGKIP